MPSDEKMEDVIGQIFRELRRAEKQHPGWPEDHIHGVAILVEEAGEAMKAALDCHYRNGTVSDLRAELAQVGAMAIRALIGLP